MVYNAKTKQKTNKQETTFFFLRKKGKEGRGRKEGKKEEKDTKEEEKKREEKRGRRRGSREGKVRRDDRQTNFMT